VIHESLSCEARQDFFALLAKVQKLLGFAYSLAAMGGYSNDSCGTVLAEIFDGGFPREFGREYVSRHYFRASRVISENFRTYRLQAWSEAWRRLHQPKEIISLCRDFGMTEGYAHGTRPLPKWRHGSFFCFSGPSIRRDPRTEAMLEHLTPHLHLALATVTYPAMEGKPSATGSSALSKREKEVLEWLKEGKSSWDASAILNISESTVNFHVRNVLRKLGVVNRAQAIAVAIRLGLIELS
jgi:DNA-binding CsgD family transcriptional regulator